MSTQRTSYLVAAMGQKKGALIQIYARSTEEACKVAAASCMDFIGAGEYETQVIDTNATPGLWYEGSASYIRSVIARATS